jgi:hypothetical protein
MNSLAGLSTCVIGIAVAVYTVSLVIDEIRASQRNRRVMAMCGLLSAGSLTLLGAGAPLVIAALR